MPADFVRCLLLAAIAARDALLRLQHTPLCESLLMRRFIGQITQLDAAFLGLR
jgi:hypothetical protein